MNLSFKMIDLEFLERFLSLLRNKKMVGKKSYRENVKNAVAFGVTSVHPSYTWSPTTAQQLCTLVQ